MSSVINTQRLTSPYKFYQNRTTPAERGKKSESFLDCLFLVILGDPLVSLHHLLSVQMSHITITRINGIASNSISIALTYGSVYGKRGSE